MMWSLMHFNSKKAQLKILNFDQWLWYRCRWHARQNDGVTGALEDHDLQTSGANPGFFSGGGALVSCSTSTPINHIVFFLQNTSCIRKPQVISGGGAHPLHPLPRSAPELLLVNPAAAIRRSMRKVLFSGSAQQWLKKGSAIWQF